MFCKNCGKEINDDAVMCVNCGTLLKPLPLVSVPAAPLAVQSDTPAEQSAPDAPAKKKVNGWAIAGFVLSFFGVVSWLCAVLGLVFSIVGLVTSKQTKSGKGLAIAGIVISVCAFVASCVILALILPYIIRAIAGIIVLLILCLVFI